MSKYEGLYEKLKYEAKNVIKKSYIKKMKNKKIKEKKLPEKKENASKQQKDNYIFEKEIYATTVSTANLLIEFAIYNFAILKLKELRPEIITEFLKDLINKKLSAKYIKTKKIGIYKLDRCLVNAGIRKKDDNPIYPTNKKIIIPPENKTNKAKPYYKKDLNSIITYIIERLKEKGVVIHKYDSFSTNSIYIKLDYGVSNSLRIADHDGKGYPYKFNLRTDIKESYKKSAKHDRYFYSTDDTEKLINHIIRHRNKKMTKYGWKYKRYMKETENEIKKKKEQNKLEDFWKHAKKIS